MVPVWILLCYGLAAVLVHLMHRMYVRGRAGAPNREHYILVTRNHEQQMEWYLRAISWYAHLRGRDCRITVFDEGSEDDTLAITQLIKNSGDLELSVYGFSGRQGEDDMRRQAAAAEGETALLIDLRVPMEAAKIPYVHV
ncbi:hypothetical protein EJP77_06415 [Paenibacillus zeisoli]|uniref:Uncharacterized protein n=1 Tax=Paenibacillus zeisoli TaxID=2496267 RepID=A0A3S1BTX9_9BACL|nr:hypothetical protein [Paenibacillus zeisoli]RUT33282.1 hypothetical protein EJP77_06415 [Paenibacillus zeisoli]